MEKIDHVVVPGTFDPVTNGHLDVIKRAKRLFGKVTVAVASSRDKNGVGTTFSLEERVEMLQKSLGEAGIEGVSVEPMGGLLVEFCHGRGAGGVVK